MANNNVRSIFRRRDTRPDPLIDEYGDDFSAWAEVGTIPDVYQPAVDGWADLQVTVGATPFSGVVIDLGPWQLTPDEARQLARLLEQSTVWIRQNVRETVG